MSEASWGGDTQTNHIDWRMSAALENVPRGKSEVAEVTSLASAVAEWGRLDAAHQEVAVLTPERPLVLNGTTHASLEGDAIAELVALLPSHAAEPPPDSAA
ncbi:hypothetical protein M9978_07910 [Sphingomonas sp. MG17]|uniref:Uncharacterized protein n=1 Tax=Sphingomonas tagetis TaxID=2949092 RepID=A0A9X2HI47_9SPHN|nr:hypothetical protein [Sphingomonas tagetis]MCP3730352.1 hypothetical protein [Sphingomonas tagetis]